MQFSFTVPEVDEATAENGLLDDTDRLPGQVQMVELDVVAPPGHRAVARRRRRHVAIVALAGLSAMALVVAVGASLTAGAGAPPADARSNGGVAPVDSAGGSGHRPCAAGGRCPDEDGTDPSVRDDIERGGRGGGRGSGQGRGHGWDDGAGGEVLPGPSYDGITCSASSHKLLLDTCTGRPGVKDRDSVGEYQCSVECSSVLGAVLQSCQLPVDEWPAMSGLSHYLQPDVKPSRIFGEHHSYSAGQKVTSPDIAGIVQIEEHKGLVEKVGQEWIKMPDRTVLFKQSVAEREMFCPAGGRCFGVGGGRVVYVLLNVTKLAGYRVVDASIEVAALDPPGRKLTKEEKQLYNRYPVMLSKCAKGHVQHFAEVAAHASSSAVFVVLKGDYDMQRMCSPVCAEMSIFGPVCFTHPSLMIAMLTGLLAIDTMRLQLSRKE